jgi:predicted HAD superfamily Cof-like phosphohydrolase
MPNDKLKRFQNLPSAKVTEKDSAKPVKVAGFGELVEQLEAMTAASVQSQESISKSLAELTQIVAAAAKDGVDIGAVVDAINGLKDKLAEKDKIKMPTDYVINFDRDKHGLMKSGIRLTSTQRKLN